MQKRIIITIVICSIACSAVCDDRIRVTARINGKDVLFAYDTGAEATVLLERTARALGLNWTSPPETLQKVPSKVALGKTKPVEIEIGNVKTTTRLGIIDVPPYVPSDIDGILSWRILRNNLIYLNAAERKMQPIKALPQNIDEWSEWKLKTDSGALYFEINLNEGASGRILIDTGSQCGVKIAKSLWQPWRARNPTKSATLKAGYMPHSGLKVFEVCWSEKLEIGNFSITDVPVSPDLDETDLLYRDYAATLGLYALSRFEIIIDYRNKLLYMKSLAAPPLDYKHNRIAAVFVPKNPSVDDCLRAHVVPNGIAYQAGIRDGDILLKINDLDVTQWRTNPDVLPLYRFFQQPAGTKLKLKLEREGKPIEVALELQDIFPPKKARQSSDGDTE